MLEIIKNKDFNRIEGIDYGFFTRKGGCSSGEFESLNTNSSAINGESEENVKKNFKIIQKYFESPYNVFKPKQIHCQCVFTLIVP